MIIPVNIAIKGAAVLGHTQESGIASHMQAGACFVVAFMRGDVLVEGRKITLHDNAGNLAFEAEVIDNTNRTAKVYVASIGKAHAEAIVTLDDLKEQFGEVGLDLIAHYPFDSLRNLFHVRSNSFSEEELQMSSLDAAAVFEKRPDPMPATPFLFSASLESLVEYEILKS